MQKKSDMRMNISQKLTDIHFSLELSPGIAPVMIGFSIGAAGMAFGYNCGFAINPARDFGPRIFTAIVWGGDVFTAKNYFFWVPILGPLVGGVVGGVIYKFVDMLHEPQEEVNAENEKLMEQNV